MTDAVIETDRLTRYFGKKCAVDSLNLAIPRGCVLALLGRNGSGKTTTIRMLLGLIQPTRGSAKILGHDSQSIPPAVRASIGYIAETHPLYGWMRIKQAGDFQSAFYPRWNGKIFSAVLDHFRLSPAARINHLSRGERAGVSLALTLAPQPTLLLLDDPALGLDPVARRSLLESILYVTRNQDRTILLSSHMLSDVERVADRIVVLDRSILRVNAAIDFFRNHIRQYLLTFAGAAPSVPAIPGLLSSRRDYHELRVVLANPTDQSVATLRSLNPASMGEIPLTLEDAVIGYLGDRGERTFFLKDTEDKNVLTEAGAA